LSFIFLPENFQVWKIFHIFCPFLFFLFLHFLLSSPFSLSSFLPHATVCTNRTEEWPAALPNAATPPWRPYLQHSQSRPRAPLLSSLSPSLPSSVRSPWPTIKLSSPAIAAHQGMPQPSSVFFVGQPKRMHTTFLFLSSASILSETNSNL
jgi:hypothetical protein